MADELIVLKYLQAQNRPYSASKPSAALVLGPRTRAIHLGTDIVDIFNNLHGQVSKPAVTRVLTSLVEKQEISGKTYKKQSVYVTRQDVLPTPSPEELQALDDQIEELKAKVATEKESLRRLQARTAIINRKPDDLLT